MVVIKVSLGDDIRRFSLSVLPTFSELRGMLEKLFSTTIAGVYDVKYLDPENDQITVTNDTELVDAFGMASQVGEQKLLRLYLVPKGTNPALAASTMQTSRTSPPTMDVDLTPLLASLSNSANPNALANILSSLLTGSHASSNNNQQNQHCPWLASRPESAPRIHAHYVCDGCEMTPITGDLHQCDVCPDYHLCQGCRDSGVHLDKNHTFTINPPRRHQHHPGFRFPRRGPALQQQQQQQQPAQQPQKPTQPQQPAQDPFSPPVTTVPTKPPVPVVSGTPVPTSPSTGAGIVEQTKSPLVPQVQVVPAENLEMAFLGDVTIPDGTEMAVGETFNKVWRLSNSGHIAWPLGCRLRLESNTGERLSSVETIDIPGEVPPGSAVTISVEMEAPKKAGRHVSYWRMYGPSGQPFGARIWVDIIGIDKPQPAPPKTAVVSTPAPAIRPNEQYASQLESLYRMGFLNVDLNRNLLEHNKGNVAAVIEQLIAHQH